MFYFSTLEFQPIQKLRIIQLYTNKMFCKIIFTIPEADISLCTVAFLKPKLARIQYYIMHVYNKMLTGE